MVLAAGTPSEATQEITFSMIAPLDEDTLLVRRCSDGDASAFEKLYQKYVRLVYSVAYRMVPGEEAHDLTQEVFIRAFKNIRSFRGDSSFRAWLLRIAHNLCCNRLRDMKRERTDSLEEMAERENGGYEPISQEDLQAHVERDELQRKVREVLARLPEDYRTMLILRDFEQLSYEEISHITGLTIANVKSRLHRARLAFKRLFEPYYRVYYQGVGE
ncbi:MAG: sigma-70 family RNA polymerase sigma factor [Armatimonadota bacterium]|nr:sigma-70 family RNA polymerase sigma factor [bacterium]MDW8321231.1 sigma-70 family RNA polymerase sigma factor [Armatimonadota bacterium]